MADIAPHLDWLGLVASAAGVMVDIDPSRYKAIGTGPIVLSDRRIVSRSPESCIYVHHWNRSDPDHMHDHPWDNCSVVLTVGYFEVTPEGRFWRPPGSVVFRRAEDLHRIELDPNLGKPTSLFITAAERRRWGFHMPDGSFVPGPDYRSHASFAARAAGGLIDA